MWDRDCWSARVMGRNKSSESVFFHLWFLEDHVCHGHTKPCWFFFWCYRVHWQLIIPMMSWPALGWQKKHRVWQWTLHLGCWCLKDSLRWEQAAEFMRYSHRSVLLSIQFSAGITSRAHTSDACQSFQSMLQWCILLIPHPPFPSTQIQLLLVPAITPWLSFAQVTMLISRDNLIAYSLGNCK